MLRAALLLACLSASAPARADVIVLDQSGAGDVTTLKQLVDLAVDGDIVLVRPGTYGAPPSGLTFQGKALTIVADGTGPVNFPTLQVMGVPAGKVFTLRGVRMAQASETVTARLSINFSAGLVLLEDCTIVGTSPFNFLPTIAVNIGTANASFESCLIAGPPGKNDNLVTIGALPGGWGMICGSANITLADCTLTGGAGGSELAAVATEGAAAGAPALKANASNLTISGCALAGGAGGDDTGTPLPAGPAAGGAALLANPITTVWLRDSTTVGGAGGTDASGNIGPAGADAAGPVTLLPGPARRLRVSAPIIEGQAASLVVDGAPLELAFALISSGSTWLPVPKFGGALVVGSPVTAPVFLGPLDAAGHLQLDFVAPAMGLPLGTGVAGIMQLATVAGGDVVLGDLSALIVLSAGF